MGEVTIREFPVRVLRLLESYADVATGDLNGVQQVFIDDYRQALALGEVELAAEVLGVINDFGAMYDLRDGTVSREVARFGFLGCQECWSELAFCGPVVRFCTPGGLVRGERLARFGWVLGGEDLGLSVRVSFPSGEWVFGVDETVEVLGRWSVSVPRGVDGVSAGALGSAVVGDCGLCGAFSEGLRRVWGWLAG